MLRRQLSWLHVIFGELDAAGVMGLTAFMLELEAVVGVNGDAVDAGAGVESTADEV